MKEWLAVLALCGWIAFGVTLANAIHIAQRARGLADMLERPQVVHVYLDGTELEGIAWKGVVVRDEEVEP